MFPPRLFAGIQGDKQRQGELFGLKNLFSLKEELATKEQIEEAHMSNLEWAMAHTTSSRSEQDDVSDRPSCQRDYVTNHRCLGNAFLN